MSIVTKTIDTIETDGFPRILRELNRFYYKVRNPEGYYRNGTDFIEEDWDNCIILDACRFDMFQELNHIEGQLEHRISRGSQTREFLKANLDGKILHDTVYITANPQLYKYQDEIDVEFHNVIEIWKDHWNPETKTVPPEIVTEIAKEAATEFPQKRLLIHYLQPHYPFINSNFEYDKNGHIHEDKANIWRRKLRNEIDISNELIWEYYRDNLEFVLETVENLVYSLSGKTVITADHGNMVGERSFPIPAKDWGHPSSLYTEELVKVPWLIMDTDDRKRITETPPRQSKADVASQTVENRLADIGYLS